MLHHMKVIYCDIKPENTLLRENQTVSNADFGVSKRMPATNAKTVRTYVKVEGATAAYAPPQQVLRISPVRSKINAYAMSTTLIFALSLKEPFGPATDNDYVRQHEKRQKNRVPKTCPSEMKDLLS